MLVAALLLVYSFLVCYLLGSCFYCILKYRFHIADEQPVSFPMAVILGLCFAAIATAIWHLFLPVNLYLHAVLILILTAFYILIEGNLKADFVNLFNQLKAHGLILGVLFLVAIVSIVARPGTGDIADYHLQAIKWAEQFKNIFGLGNFNRPLANNNWWFNLQALFGLSFFGVQSVYVLNGLLFFCALSLLLFDETKSNFLLIFKFVLAAFVAVSTKTAFVGSVTPDYVITTLIFISAYLFLKFLLHENASKQNLLFVFIISAFAITIKLNAVVLPLLGLISMWHLMNKKWSGKIVILGAFTFSLFLIPWLAANIIVCGWLCYPVSQIDLFNVDWKLPKEVLDYERFSIQQWGKIPLQDVYVTAQFSFGQWFPVWLKNLDPFNKVLVAATLFVPLLFFGAVIIKRQSCFLIVGLLSAAGIVFCFLNGPHIRYAYGYMVVLLALSLAYLMQDKLKFNGTKSIVLLLIIAVLGVLPKVVVLYEKGLISSSFINPTPYAKHTIEEINLGAQNVFVTKQNSTCWETFPCSYYMVENCKMRGETFEDGFYIPQSHLQNLQ